MRHARHIGVNLGDVIIEGDDIHGDGVNVAARLEALADPGSVIVSGMVHEAVRAKLEFGFDDLGLQTVKNIAEPVRAYLVLPEGQQVVVPSRMKASSRWRIPAIVATVLVLIAAGGIAWWQPWIPDGERASIDKMAFKLPDKPSIAVLPFTNMSDDKAQGYFSDGITEDIITDLSKISGLFVIARTPSFRYKGRTFDAKRVGRELGVKYLLEGAVRRAGDQVRINAKLIDVETGGQIWAERYDGKFANTFSLQDKVTGRIIEALSLKLGADERARLGDHGTNNFEAHDAYLEGQSYARQFTTEGFASAIEHFRRALELDPNYKRAATAISQIRYIKENSGLR
jgi:TolB-like protein